jgi:hypothetical protein
MSKLAALGTFLCTTLWVNNAYAFCILGLCIGGGGGDGGASPAPELDGPGALSAAALVICVGAIVYRRLHRR